MKKYIILAVGAFLPVAVSAQLALPDNPGLARGGISDAIANVVTLLAGLLAVLAILMIVISGIMYITAVGDRSRIDRAKSTLLYAIIGLIVALLAWVIVSTIAGALGAG